MIVIAMKKSLILSFLISLMVLGGCSQIELEQTNKIEEGEVLEIKDQELSFSIFQIVSIDLGETTFSDGQILGTTLEGEKIDLFIEDNILTFMVPKLNQGNYKLVFSENSKPFNIAFEVKAHELKDTPGAYLEKYKNIALEQIAVLEKGNGPVSGEKDEDLEKDIALLKQQTEEQFAKAALLNESELTDMAYFFEANNQWFTEILNTAIDLEADFPDARLLQDQVLNVEQQSGYFSNRLTTSVLQVAGKIAIVPVMGAIGGLLGVEFGTPGIVIGVSIGLYSGYLILKRLTVRVDQLFSLIQVPNDSQVNVNVRASYIFENDEPTELLIYRNYRDLYSKDKESTIPYIKNYVLASQTMSEAWEDLIRNIKLINDKLDLSYKPINPASLDNFETTLFRVHSDHLNFSGISNSKVTGSAKKEDGKLFLTFNTSETDAQEFDFKLIYENQDFGKLEKTLDVAVINSGCSVKLELTDKNVLTATATGYGPFKFVWSSGENVTEAKTHAVKMARFGEYSVTVTDQNGCESKATATVPCTLRIDVRNEGNTFTVEALDGVPPFNFYWSTNNFANPQTLPPGTHTVKVIDGLGCEILHTINIGCNMDVSVKKDGNNLTAQATGGTAPYTFTWSNGTISPSLSNLAPGTYSVVAKDKVGCEKSASVTIEEEGPEYGTFTDPRDGNVYKTVKIGNQTWFAENLRYAGNIPQVASKEEWLKIYYNKTSQPAWVYYNNDPNYNSIYGKLYNWYAVNTGSLCSQGWHIPTLEEWKYLRDFLGGYLVGGGKMKSQTGWNAPNQGATNESGFSGLPGGERYFNSNSEFYGLGKYGFWWSSSTRDDRDAYSFSLYYTDSNPYLVYYEKVRAQSCRCIKD
jgi:uncharacterized protein (TIGR02145 family)